MNTLTILLCWKVTYFCWNVLERVGNIPRFVGKLARFVGKPPSRFQQKPNKIQQIHPVSNSFPTTFQQKQQAKPAQLAGNALFKSLLELLDVLEAKNSVLPKKIRF
jgi:hypothetical protein